MASRLPATQDSTLAVPGVQSSLFGSPLELLEVDDAELRRVAALVGHEAGSVLVQVRRMAGLVAWAAWYRMDESSYREFAAGMASDLGIEVETLRKWRRSVVAKEKLPVPGVAGQRAAAAEKGRKTAGQTAGAVRTSATPAPIPAASTEAPAKPSEGVVKDTTVNASASSYVAPAPSDQSSGGAELQLSAEPTDVAAPKRPTSRSAPPGPSLQQVVITGNEAESKRDATTPDLLDPSERPPSDRQLAARAYAAMRDIDPTDAGPVTTSEEATFLRQWAQRTLDAWKAKNVPTNGTAAYQMMADQHDGAKPPAKRRQGTISRPSDRAPKTPVKVNGASIAGSLTRRTVEPMFKP